MITGNPTILMLTSNAYEKCMQWIKETKRRKCIVLTANEKRIFQNGDVLFLAKDYETTSPEVLCLSDFFDQYKIRTKEYFLASPGIYGTYRNEGQLRRKDVDFTVAVGIKGIEKAVPLYNDKYQIFIRLSAPDTRRYGSGEFSKVVELCQRRDINL